MKLFFALIASLYFVSGVLGQDSNLHPPFKRVWSFPVSTRLPSVVFIGKNGYFADDSGYARFDSKSGAIIWRQPRSNDGCLLYSFKDRLFVVTPNLLLEADPKSGQPLWSVTTESFGLVIGDQNGFLFRQKSNDWALMDLTTRKVRWHDSLGATDQAPLINLKPSGNVLVVSTRDGKLAGYSLATGMRVWATVSGEQLAMIDANDRFALALFFDGSVGICETARGTVVWKSEPVNPESARLFGDSVLITTVERQLIQMRISDAKEQGRYELSAKIDPAEFLLAPVFNDTIWLGQGDHVLSLGSNADNNWKFPWLEKRGVPIHVDSTGWLATGLNFQNRGSWISRYEPGVEPEPTTLAEKRALATKLLDGWRRGTDGDHERFKALGHDVYDLLVERIAKTGLDSEEAMRSTESLYSWHEILAGWTTKDDTDYLISEIKKTTDDDEGRFDLLAILEEKGDIEKASPFFLELAKKDPNDTVSLKAVTESVAPENVKYAISMLMNPKANAFGRHYAYLNLALNGGDAGRAAVLEMRSHQEKLPSLAVRMKLSELPAKMPSEPADTDMILATHGKYALIGSDILGTEGLFIVRRQNGKWVDPLYTGVSEDAGIYGEEDSDKNFAAYQKMVSGDWIKLIGNPKLSKDSDGDGLTDLEEARLGTDPHKADSDGDGISDLYDQNPLVAAHALSEDQKIVWAALETGFRFWNTSASPIVVQFEGVKPFEVSGFDGYVLPHDRVHGKPSTDIYSAHVALDPPRPDGTRIVRVTGLHMQDDRTYTLKKFGAEWFVIKLVESKANPGIS